MVVVVIIGILAFLGVRVYAGQQDKAKNVVVKANCSTIQTLIQANMADKDYNQTGETPEADCKERLIAVLKDIEDIGNEAAGCRNPYTDGTDITGPNGVIRPLSDILHDVSSVDRGKVAIASPEPNKFLLQGLDKDGKLFGEVLIAQK